MTNRQQQAANRLKVQLSSIPKERIAEPRENREWFASEHLETCAASILVTEQGGIVPIRCKSWDCPTCAALNAREHSIRVANGVQALQLAGCDLRFITLTLPGGIKTSEWAYAHLADMWDKFRNRMQYRTRLLGIPFAYAAFAEEHRDHIPHFHIIATYSPPKEVLRKIAVKSGLGYEIETVRPRKSKGVAWYIAKYISKTSSKLGMPPKFRRVRYSENWPRMYFRRELEEKDPCMTMHYGETIEQFADRVYQVLGKPVYDRLWRFVSDLNESSMQMLGRVKVLTGDEGLAE